VFVIRAQNDGSVPDDVLLRGTRTAGAANFRVRWFRDTTDITSQVLAGTATLADLASHGTAQIRLQVTPLASAPAGAVFAVTTTLRSPSGPLDAVRVIIHVPS
jgi:hypothetical protein